MRILILLLLMTAPVVHAQDRVAFLGLSLLDTSLQTTELGRDPAELRRLEMLEQMIADRFQAEGFVLVDLAPAQVEIDRHVNLAKCYGCDARIAQSLGADFVLVGEVQKTSNLIIAMNLQLRDAQTGQTQRGGVADIRGNTDESWTRGMRYILKNRMFPAQTQ